MAEIKPQHIANILVENGSNSSFLTLEKVIFEHLSINLSSLSEEEISELAEKHKPDVARELFEKIESLAEDGVTCNYEIEEDSGDFYIKFFERFEIKYLRKLQKDTPANFEIFCKSILEKLGATASVNGGSYDGGIDFIGYDLPISITGTPTTIGSKVLVVGQAKRYKDNNHVTEKELREFVGGATRKINEIKRKNPTQVGGLQPIIYAFWTTSDFHINARSFARDLGIWYLNGPALCQFATKIGLQDTCD